MSVARPALLLAAALAVAALSLEGASAGALPEWSVAGSHDEQLAVGFRDLSGNYTFTLEGEASSLSLSYDDAARLGGGTIVGTSIGQGMDAQWTYDASTGTTELTLEESQRQPRFRFEGTAAADGGDISGTYTRTDGFAGMPGSGGGPLLFRRQGEKGSDAFRLRFEARMDTKGRVKGALAPDGVTEKLGTLLVHGGRTLAAGKVRGKVRTRARDGTTSARLKIAGSGFKVTLEGPVDQDGFHATAAVKAVGFRAGGLAVTLPVVPGPEPPPPPPPPPEKNEVEGTFRVSNGLVEVRVRLKSKVYGKAGNLTIQFADTEQSGTFHADPASALLPKARFVSLVIGSKRYGSAIPASDVTLVNSRAGNSLTVRASGTIFRENGRSRTVEPGGHPDLVVEAALVP